MTIDSQHTPTPWKVVGTGPALRIDGANGYAIINFRHENRVEANAAFIVRACNAHGGLVAQLTNACNRLRPTSNTYFKGNPEFAWYDAMLDVLAIAKAEAK